MITTAFQICRVHTGNLKFSSYSAGIDFSGHNLTTKVYHRTVRGFVKLKKTQKWVGGSSPNSDYYFFLEILCFFVLFLCFEMFLNKMKNWIGVRGWGLTNPSFFRIFLIFLTWQDTYIVFVVLMI